MRLLDKIASVYKLRILAVGDCLIDVSSIPVSVCKNRVILAEPIIDLSQSLDVIKPKLKAFLWNHF